MKKIVLALVAVATAVAAAGVGGRTEPAAAALPGCAKDSLNLVQDGVLTIGTDNPAFPPWFGGDEKAPWKVSDPRSGKGFESAVAYAIAKRLGFTKAQVHWIYVPFNRSFAPGNKNFDFDINQISITAERGKVVTFSKPYYDVNQSVVGVKGKPISSVRSIKGLKNFKLGAQLGTTSYRYIVNRIKPSQSVAVFDTNDAAVAALKNGQIDGLVVDLPTAFYVTAVQIPNGKIVGQFPSFGAGEHFGLVFEKGNPLVSCVNKAIAQMKRTKVLQRIQQIWLAKVTGAPVLR